MSDEDLNTMIDAEALSIEERIESWWVNHFPGSIIARDTQAWNVAHAAKEQLKRLLKESI